MSPPKKPRLIAIVEDDVAVLDALEFALHTQGYDVCAFERGGDALDSPKIAGADCLVIDYAMPEMDGLTLLQALRLRGLTCPAIIIAGNPTAKCRQGALAAGAPVLEKPLMDDALGHGIRAALAQPKRDRTSQRRRPDPGVDVDQSAAKSGQVRLPAWRRGPAFTFGDGS